MAAIGITGSSGTLGRLLLERLRATAERPACFEGDVRSRGDLEAWLARERPTRLIHLAARVPVDVVEQDPLGAFQVNVGGTLNLLTALAQLDLCPWFFYASSSHVYRSLDRPIVESDAIAPQNTYGETKLLGEELVRFHARHGGLRACVGRIFSFYHPSQSKTFLFPAMKERLAVHDRSQAFTVRGGNSVRDLSSAEQVVDWILRLMRREYEGVVNVGSGRGTRIADFVAGIAEGGLEIEVPAADPATSIVADVSLLRSVLDHG